MKIFKIIPLILIATFSVLQANAQYNYTSKSAKKLHMKLEKAYEEYDYTTILDSETKIIESFEQARDTLTATMYSFLAEAYLDAGDPNKSLEYYYKEYGIRDALGDVNESKYLLSNIATLQDEMGQYKDSEQTYLDILSSDEKEFGKTHPEYLESVVALGIHYEYAKEFDKGIKFIRSNLKNFEKDTEQYARVVKGLGTLYLWNGEYKQSYKHLKEAIETNDQIDNYASVNNALTYVTFAGLMSKQAKYPAAEELLNEAETILLKTPGENDIYLSTVYHEKGIVYRKLGNYKLSEDNFNKSINISEKIFTKVSINYLDGIDELGNLYENQGRYEESLQKYGEEKAILEENFGTDNITYSFMLANSSKVHRRLKNYEASEKNLLQAMALDKELLGENHPDYASDLFSLGMLYYNTHDFKKAEKYLEDGKKVYAGSLGKRHARYAKVTLAIANMHWKINDLKTAEKYYKETFSNYFSQIEAYFPTLSEEEKANFYQNKIRTSFEQFNSFAVARKDESPFLLSDMYNYQLATKGLILYATKKVRETIMNSGDETVIKKYNKWLGAKERLSILYSANNIPLEKRNKEIDSLATVANTLEKELSASSGAFAETYSKKSETWQEVQSRLKPGEAAIEVVRYNNFSPDSAGIYTGEVHYAALIVKPETKNNPELVLLKNGVKMENRYLANYRNAIQYKVNEKYSYKLFWQPIAEKLDGVNKVYFSPDGIYNQISIYTLRNPATDNYTLDEIDIHLVNNTKDLLAFKGGSKPFDSNKAQLIGFPNYNMGSLEEDKERQKSIASDIANKASLGRGTRGTRGTRGVEAKNATIEGSLSRGLRGSMLRYMNGNSLLASLPGTKREVESIKTLYDDNKFNYEILMENNAMESALKKTKKPQTLHIATHGFFLEQENSASAGESDKYIENPLLRSGLVLAGANSFLRTGQISEDFSDGEDGILTAYEVMNMNLDETDLVVLSACETGLGEISNGEGVYGLQRAFKIAGAKSIIMSMWTVDDDATQELMTTFYAEWLKNGDRREAFKTAQKRIKDKWKSPYYWGAFIMVGE